MEKSSQRQPAPGYADRRTDAKLNVIAEFQRAGLRDPLEKHRELDEYRRAEAEAYQTAEQKRKDDFYQENYNR